MSYNILTETDFFKAIGSGSDQAELHKVQEAYHKFVTKVIDLCHQTTERKEALHALVFAETEFAISSFAAFRFRVCPLPVYQESPFFHP